MELSVQLHDLSDLTPEETACIMNWMGCRIGNYTILMLW